MQTLTIPSYSSPGTSDGFLSGLTKGSLTASASDAVVEGAPTEVKFQFNPEDLTITREIKWATLDTSKTDSTQQFGGSPGDTLSFTLLYDATEMSEEWASTDIVEQIENLMNLSKAVVQEMEGSMLTTRPPFLQFVLGGIKFNGGIEALNVKYLMLDAAANPVRVMVDVTLKGSAFSDNADALSSSTADVRDTKSSVD